MNMDDLKRTEALLNGYGTTYGAPWDLAPKVLADAAADAEKARAKHVETTDAVADAEIEVPAAQAEWDAEGKAAVRAGKPLPSRDVLDAAAFALTNAKEDEATAARELHAARYRVATLLSDPAVRDEWRTNIEDTLPALRDTLTTTAAAVAPVVQQVRTTVRLSVLLGDWGGVPTEAQYTRTDPAAALREIAALKEWEPIEPGTVRTIHA